MKKRTNLLLIPAVALGLAACGKKEEVKAPDAPPAVADGSMKDATVPPPAPVVPKIEVGERAAKLGFARHLPADTEVVLAFYNGSKTADRVMGSKLWKLVQQQMGMGGMGMDGGMEIDEIEMDDEDMDIQEAEQDEAMPPGGDQTLLADEEPVGPAALLGAEITLAMGKATGEQCANLLKLYRKMNYFQMRDLAKAFVEAAKSGDAGAVGEAVGDQMGDQQFFEVLKDPETGVPSIEKAKMPPVYLAFRTSESQRAAAAIEVSAMLENIGMFGPMVEPVKFDAAGTTFEGYKLLGSKIAEQMEEERESMEADLDEATVNKLLTAIGQKEIVAVSGTVGDYVVVFIGGSADDLKLAANPGESLVGSDALAFADSYVSKDLAALMYGQKDAMELLVKSAGGISDMTNGLRDGIAGSDGLGNIRDLDAMFQIVAEREAAVLALASVETQVSVAFFEEGLKIESCGGTDQGIVDWKGTNALSHLGDSEDVLLFANLTTDAAYNEKSRAFGEALIETGYALAMKIAELPFEDGEMAQFKGMAQMFDQQYRPDAVALWEAFSSGMGSGLGKESALVIDLKGGAPPVPGVPQEVIDGAKVPRISLVSPVKDRAALADSWDKINTTATGTLAKISEMVGENIPMQKPLSSEKDGNTTWFFPMPFFTDDFLPSVTVGEKWFVASSSKMQALDLIGQADAGGAGRSGLWFSMNFETLRKYADETFQLVEANAESMTGSPMSPEDAKTIKDIIAVVGDLDKLTIHSRLEDGLQRSSVYFKTR